MQNFSQFIHHCCWKNSYMRTVASQCKVSVQMPWHDTRRAMFKLPAFNVPTVDAQLALHAVEQRFICVGDQIRNVENFGPNPHSPWRAEGLLYFLFLRPFVRKSEVISIPLHGRCNPMFNLHGPTPATNFKLYTIFLQVWSSARVAIGLWLHPSYSQSKISKPSVSLLARKKTSQTRMMCCPLTEGILRFS